MTKNKQYFTMFAIVLLTAIFSFIMIFSSTNTGLAFQKTEQDKIYIYEGPPERVRKGFNAGRNQLCPPGTVSYSAESRAITAAMDAGRTCIVSKVDDKKYCCTSVFYDRFDDPLEKYLKE